MLGASFHFLMALGVAIALRWLFLGFDNLSALIHLVPVLVLLFVLGWSIAILTGFANTYFPDTQNLSEVGLQILFYATPVIVPAEVFINKGLGWIVQYNPVAAMLQVLREPILHGTSPSLPVYATAVSSVAILAGAAALTLYKLQRKIIFQL
jgi:ABC-type polysaccharide/polyol phosphate export permease